jgi:3-phosphoshikimate 1-carboxyvinyltransferase
MGIDAVHTDDAIIIHGNPECIKGAKIETYKDHRMVMSFAMAGLRVPGMIIKNPENVNKSFPDFWNVFEKMSEAIDLEEKTA